MHYGDDRYNELGADETCETKEYSMASTLRYMTELFPRKICGRRSYMFFGSLKLRLRFFPTRVLCFITINANNSIFRHHFQFFIYDWKTKHFSMIKIVSCRQTSSNMHIITLWFGEPITSLKVVRNKPFFNKFKNAFVTLRCTINFVHMKSIILLIPGIPCTTFI